MITKVYLISITLLMLLSPLDNLNAGNLDLPMASSTTIVSGNTITAGDTIDVDVKILGDTRAQSEAIPATLLFVLDRSGSMSSGGAINHLKQAVTSLISRLDASKDRVAVVAFGSGVSVLSNLTSDLMSARNSVNALNPSGLTNIAAGFREGNNILRSATAPKKVAILITDGLPEPDRVEQGRAIFNELGRLSSDLITYHTIGLGTVDPILLDTIARRTGGTFASTPSPADLEKLFREIYDAQSRLLTIKDLEVVEALSSHLVAENNSLSVSFIPSSNSAEEFKNSLDKKTPDFYANGALTFPKLYDVPGSNYFGYRFKARVNKCDERQDITVPLRTASAEINFLNGGDVRVHQRMNAPPIIIRMCGVYLSKEFDELSKTIKVHIKNSFSRPIRDVKIIDEITEAFFDFDRDDEVVPAPVTLDHSTRQIQWDFDHISSNSSKELTFYIKDVAPGPAAIYPIETDDWWSTWLFEKPAFNILRSQPEFLELKNDLQTGVASPAVDQLIALEMRLNQLPKNGVVIAAPPLLTSEGYNWQLKYALGRDIFFPAPTSTRGGFDDFTGNFFVRVHEDRLEVIAEVLRKERLPMISTSPDYEPKP